MASPREFDRNLLIGALATQWGERRSNAIQMLESVSQAISVSVARERAAPGVDASDLVDEMVLRVLSDDGAALRRAAPDAPLGAWIRRFLINLARESWHAEARAHRRLEDVDLALARRRVAASQMRRMRLRPLMPRVDQLTESQRFALDRYLDGWRLTDIASAREGSTSSTRELLRRAIHRLRVSPPTGGSSLPPPPAASATLARLSSKARAIYSIWLRVRQPGLVAAELQISPSACRQRLYRVRRKVEHAAGLGSRA